MTRQGLVESRQQGKTLLAQRRKIAADATKASEPLISAKATGDFLLDLDHAQIAFGLIVAKWHGKIQQKGQHLPFERREPVQ